MRDYGKVHTSLWSSETLKGLDSDARLLALYLLTSPHTTMIGAFRLPDAYACDDLGWDSERLRNGYETLEGVGFIQLDPDAKWIWIVNFLKFNRPDNPNQWKAARKLAAAIPDSVSLKDAVSGTVLEPLNNTPVPVPASVPVPKAESSDAPVVLDAYHRLLPNCQRVSVMGPKRKRLIAAAVKQAKALCRDQGWPYDPAEFWDAYFTECAADPWLRGDKPNPKNPDWKQKLDTVLDETRFTAVMDRALATMRASA